jgi:hypothetical protein
LSYGGLDPNMYVVVVPLTRVLYELHFHGGNLAESCPILTTEFRKEFLICAYIHVKFCILADMIEGNNCVKYDKNPLDVRNFSPSEVTCPMVLMILVIRKYITL